MYLGIDLGTSAVKVVLADENDSIVGDASAALEVSRPAPLHSEQDPEDWWTACDAAIRRLGQAHDLSAVRGIGLSGQMHGATLLGEDATQAEAFSAALRQLSVLS